MKYIVEDKTITLEIELFPELCIKYLIVNF